VHTGYDDIDALADAVRKAQEFFGVATPVTTGEVG
jgi:cysteine desulfurase / selenocysteine lyase